MRPSGYRPISVRPRGDGRTAAVVWARDGVDWRLMAGLALEELKAADACRQEEGLLPDDVAAYQTPQGRRFVGLWRRGGKGEKAELYADLLAPALQAEYARLRGRGLTTWRHQALLCDDGLMRYAAVWATPPKPGMVTLIVQDARPQFASRVRGEERLALGAQVSPAPPSVDARVRALLDLEAERAAVAPWAAAAVACGSPWSALALLAKGHDPTRLHRIGFALYKARRDAEAVRALDAYLLDAAERRSKPLVSAYRYQALIHARNGREADARGDAKLYRDANPPPQLAFSTDAEVDLYLGQEAAALKAADEAAGKGPLFAYEAACVYSRAAERRRQRQAAAVAGLVGAPLLRALGALAGVPAGAPERLAERGLALLRQAVAEGYANWANLRSDADLAEVHALPAYERWVIEQGGARHYDSVWSPAADREAAALFDLGPDDHLARCRELAAEGYRPVSLALAALPLEGKTVVSSVWHRPVLAEDVRGRLAARRGTAAALLLALGESEQVWPLWKQKPDPAVRNHLVARAAVVRVDPRRLIARLESEKDPSVRRALILSLGEYADAELPSRLREPLVKRLLAWYRDDPDPGVHSAIDWLLRHKDEGPTPRPLDWGQAEALDRIDRERVGKPTAGWYVNGQGQTMVCVKGPVEFRSGSPPYEARRLTNETPRWRRIRRDFAIGSKPVTAEQWERFVADQPASQRPLLRPQATPPQEGVPAAYVTWFAAAQYCNWLSKQEGIDESEWCYPSKIGPNMKMEPGHLKKKGYRLPTACEWEYACRAGTTTTHFAGADLGLVRRYSFSRADSSGRAWPVGQKRPNDLGLFDSLGNVYHWCQERSGNEPTTLTVVPIEDEEDLLPIVGRQDRRLRGGSYDVLPSALRSAVQYVGTPGQPRSAVYGLRVARTMK
jgi:formylglycine-generating enzyme required for sulfatase activity